VNRPLWRPWIQPFLVLIIVIVIPPLLYWFVYVQQRIEAAKEHDFGTLAAVSSALKEGVTSYNRIAANASCADNPGEFLKTLPKAQVVSLPGSGATNKPLTELGKGAQGGINLNVQANPECQPPGSPASQGSVIAHIPLENVVPWPLVESEFDGLLIFRGSGDYGLVAQDRRLPLQPLGIAITLHNADSNISIEEFLDKKNGVDPAQASPLDLTKAWAVRVAGRDYLPFIQRVSVPVEKTDRTPSGDIQLVVCGLIEARTLRREAIELEPHTLVGVVSFVLLGLLSIPFLKLRFIGRNERMRRIDVWLLGVSVLGVAALLMLMVLHELSTPLLRERFDRGLISFAQAIEDHTKDELELIRKQLEDVEADNRLFEDAGANAVTAVKLRGSILTQMDFSYPLFEAFFYAGRSAEGKQQSKLMARTIPTAMVGVGVVPYYANGLALHRIPADGQEYGELPRTRFAFSPDVSITSGLQLGTFSVPASLKNHRLGMQALGADLPVSDRDGILALATPLPSLNDAIVSAPFQFVVLDETDSVAFQLASGPYRGEKFFDSMPQGEELRQSMQPIDSASWGASGIRAYDYHGGSYRMLAGRLTAFPFAGAPDPPARTDLVAYYDTGSFEALAATAFETGALLSLATILSILSGAVAARFAFGTHALGWAWLSAESVQWYLRMIVGVLILSVVLIWVTGRYQSVAPWLLVVAPGIATFAMGAMCCFMHKRTDLGGHDSRRLSQVNRGSYKVIFVLFWATCIVGIIVIPAALAFDYGLTFSAELFEQKTARKLNSDWSTRRPLKGQPLVAADDAAGAPDPPCGAPVKTVSPDPRCAATDRIYANRKNYASFERLERSLRRYDACVDLRTCNRSGTNFGKPATAVKAFDPGSWALPVQFGRGELYKLMTTPSAALWLGVALLLELAVLAALVHSVSKNVLGLELIEDPTLPAPELGSMEFKSNGRWLLLRPDTRSTKPLLDRGDVSPIDLCSSTARADTLASDLPAGKTTLVVTHVEHRLPDAGWRLALLRLLSCNANRAIVLVSEVDPFYYVARRLREKVDALQSAALPVCAAVQNECDALQAELAEWAVLLRDAQKVRYDTRYAELREPCEFAASLELAHGIRRDRILWDRILRECQGSNTLREIGARLCKPLTESNRYSWPEAVRLIQDAAEPYYRSVWDLCSQEEKLVLIQLAQEGLVNPKRTEIVRRLARRGLVQLYPRFAVMNESFRAFLLNVELPESVASWEAQATAYTWKRISVPLYTLGAVVVAILLFTEQTAFTSLLAIITGAAGTMGSLRKIYALAKSTTTADKVA
jgi:hypothetical protein